jgi:hypothetical protein
MWTEAANEILIGHGVSMEHREDWQILAQCRMPKHAYVRPVSSHSSMTKALLGSWRFVAKTWASEKHLKNAAQLKPMRGWHAGRCGEPSLLRGAGEKDIEPACHSMQSRWAFAHEGERNHKVLQITKRSSLEVNWMSHPRRQQNARVKGINYNLAKKSLQQSSGPFNAGACMHRQMPRTKRS